MKKLLVRILTIILALTSVFAISLFSGCDCGGNGNINVIPRPNDEVEKFLNLDFSELNLIVGDEAKLTASYIKEDGKTLTFTTEDPNIVSIDNKGNVEAMNKGTTKIKATYGDLTAECTVNVIFGSYLPELSFEGGVADAYYVGLDGKLFEITPVVKFNGKTFYDVDAEYTIADPSIVTLENGNGFKGLKLGKTTATIKATWRGFTIDVAPALQKEVNIETKNVANFLVNGDIYDIIEMSTYNGVWGDKSYSNTFDFKVEVEYNGSIIDSSSVKTRISDTKVATLNNGVINSKLRGKTVVNIEYTDSLGEKFTHEINVVVTRPVAESGKYFKYFSSGTGYYKVPENNWANKSIINDVFGSDASKVVDAFTEDGMTLRVEGDKVLDVPGFATAPIDNVIIVGTETYAYKIGVETYGVIVADKEDLKAFNVGYRYSEEDFNKASDKVKYLQDMKERPFEYVDGYSILVNDIDASGITFNHEAIIPLESVVHTPAYTVENNLFVEMEGVNANIEYDGVSYTIPREGYPVLRADLVLNAPIGLRGLFDGQGYKIYNANVKRTEDDTVKGVGIFGAITNGAIIRNVAFVDINAQNSTALGYHLVGGNSAGPYVENVLPKIENVYIKLSEETTTPYGLFANDGATSPNTNKYGHYRFDVTNVIVDATSITAGTGLYSSNGIRNTNNSLRGHYTNFFIAVHEGNVVSKATIDLLVDERFGSGYVDIITAPTMEELFSKNDFYKDYAPTPSMGFAPNLATTMAKEFANNPYFEIVGNGVFFKGLAKDQALNFVDGEGKPLSAISLSVNRPEQEVYLVDASSNKVQNPQVRFSNSNVLEYVNGFIRVKSNILGIYEATFTYGEYSKTISVEIGARIEALKGYLQEDGEVVAEGLDVNMLDGATYQVNGVNVDGRVESGKVYVNLNGADLSGVEYMNTVTVLIKTTHEVNFEIASAYVTLAIDEAEDLTYFNVGYKFDQAEYESASDKDAYLAKIAADPFDYYEGYYVLTKDIDASEVVFNHEAAAFVFADNATSTNLTAGILTSDGTTLTALNTNATIGGYVIPREGYPIVVSNVYNGRWRPYYGLAVYKASKVGFNGTFDGQGHVITGLNQTSRDAIKYYTSAEDTDMSGSATIGAGLFGAIYTDAVIKNVAFTDVNVSNSSGLAMYYIYDGTGSGSTGKRGTLTDVYIETAESNENWGVLSTFNGSGRSWNLDHVIINAVSHTENSAMNYIGSSFEARYLYGGIFGGDSKDMGGNNGLIVQASQTFIVAQAAAASDITSNDNAPAFQDVTVVNSLDALWSATTNADSTITIQDAYADRECWEFIGNCVFFKGLATSDALSFVDGEGNKLTSVLLNKVLTEQEIYLADATGAKLSGVEVTLSNTDVLEYVDGKVKIKENVLGEYEATFTYGEYSKTISIEIGAEIVTLDGGYLQEANGEIVAVNGLNVNALEGATYTVNGVNVDGRVESGKVLLTLDGVDLSGVEYNSNVAVVLKTTEGVNYSLSLQYVTVAIDEAEDLTCFNVGYKYDATEHANASNEDEYLAKIAADPFDHYEGYYVLTKDIDASSVKFEHEAVTFVYADKVNSVNAEVGFEYNGGLKALNTNATINGYNIPREGYPVVFSNYKHTNGQIRPYPGFASVGFSATYNIGFGGTFDGQGYEITGLNKTKRSEVKYYTSAEDTEMSGTETIGAGLFGVINYNAIIKNVAFTEVNVSDSAGLAMYLAGHPNTYVNSSPVTYERADIIDTYISTAESTDNWGVVTSVNPRNRAFYLDHVIIDASGHTGTPVYTKLATLHQNYNNRYGYILGGDAAAANNGMISQASDMFIIAEATEFALTTTSASTQDITVVKSISDLWSAVTRDNSTTIQDAYTGRDMWVVADTDSDGVNEVIFKGLYNN